MRDVIAGGGLVSDQIVIALIEDRLSQGDAAGGAIFDGFPRTVAQGQALDAMLARRGSQIDLVLNLKVDEAALLGRVGARFAAEGRPDDNPDVFASRLEIYARQTQPLLAYYSETQKLQEVDGMASAQEVVVSIDAALRRASPTTDGGSAA